MIDQTQRDATTTAASVIEARGLRVRFGSVVALDGVDFALRRGEIHALMGENGAGKSTLVRCLLGVQPVAEGEIRVDGRLARIDSPRDAAALGIAAVPQEVALIGGMSIAENISLGREPRRRWWPRLIRWRDVRSTARAALARIGLAGFDVTTPLASCSVAVQQLVSIARAVDAQPRILLLDEPTSSLDRDECAQVFAVLRRLREQGIAVLFITHFLDQVDAIADRVTVLRDGRLVGVHEARSLSRAALVAAMVGREFEAVATTTHPSRGDSTSVSDALLDARGIGRRGALEHVDLAIHAGEAVGLAGLLGSGRSETARLLFGADRMDRGELRVDGKAVRFGSPRAAIAAGIAFTPENRKLDGVIPSLSLRENIMLALQAKRGLLRRMSAVEQERLADRLIAALGIRASDARAPIAQLSGGNQQKAMLARWLATAPRLLLLDEPTRGIDVAAKAEILRHIDAMRSTGMAILLISSELEEIVGTCSRVIVMRDRRSVGELRGDDIHEQTVLAAVAGRRDGAER